MNDVAKKLRLASHKTGENCRCKRLQRLESISAEARKVILQTLNSLLSHNEQNSYLCGLISTHPIPRRRPRKNAEESNFHDKGYRYRVRMLRKALCKISVCYKAFMKSLKFTGGSPRDARGRPFNNSNKLSDTVIANVCKHTGFFKSRKSHYSLHKTQKLYLSEDLNILKAHNLYKEKYPEFPLLYESYRNIFNRKFNISFGYPRVETCSTCDEFAAKIKNLKNSTQENREDIMTTINTLTVK
ncbi:hypothetical protein RN001_010198 [Aquatica leii]|uniref:Uncharacterized protein n=1 Tax=Aquatica leii TaxID=1421715 RepID=A0AAN7P684_9COLE|nr:hypothetical protein RN001_010198 [Aquatica leii]